MTMTKDQAITLISDIQRIPGILAVWTNSGEMWLASGDNKANAAGVTGIARALQLADDNGARAIVFGVTLSYHGEGVVTALPLGHNSMKSICRAVRRSVARMQKPAKNGTTREFAGGGVASF